MTNYSSTKQGTGAEEKFPAVAFSTLPLRGSTETEEKFITQNYEHILLKGICDLPYFSKFVTKVIPAFINLYHMIHSVAPPPKKNLFFARSLSVLPLRTSGFDFESVQSVIFYLTDSILLASRRT